jgi:glycosyltransferase involved in cell wall biosynthesis
LILILFTATYPYDGSAEQTFLNREIEHLASTFDKVVLIPQDRSGNRLRIPRNVDVVEEYALEIKENHPYRRALLSGLFYEELLAKGPTFLLKPKLDELVGFIAGAEFTAEWISRYIEENSFEPTQCIVYTYWFDRISLGAGLAKRHRHIAVVSRAHGTDLYEERHKWSYIPCRKQALHHLDKLFPDSDRGTRYLKERYPQYSTKIQTARLGVFDPGFIASPSQDGALRIASCSFLVPLKRIDLLIRGVSEAAKLRPNQSFEWNHFGTGPLKESLKRFAQETLPTNVRHKFRGYVSQDHLMQYYRDNPVDAFINVSETEGTSVAVMEAISCGIPIVATAVGGNPEIVTEENGLLLSPDPSVREVANALLFFLDDPVAAKNKRKGSREVWQRRYNSERNFPAFATSLKVVRNSSR